MCYCHYENKPQNYFLEYFDLFYNFVITILITFQILCLTMTFTKWMMPGAVDMDLMNITIRPTINILIMKVSFALCSRNFQNVKLRLDFVEIWSLYRHSDFMLNRILANSNSPNMSLLEIIEILNFEIW